LELEFPKQLSRNCFHGPVSKQIRKGIEDGSNVEFNATAIQTIVSQLCPACGLCCNGTLFGDVELQSGDQPGELTALGLVIERRGGKSRFPQPCSCFDGKLCRIYDDRPGRCRTFECRLLQQVNVGNIKPEVALKSIARARRIVRLVRNLLRKLGQDDEHLPLSRRCAKVMAQPLDLSGDETSIELRRRLMLAIQKLTEVLRTDFLT
jgi:hypothetical protein